MKERTTGSSLPFEVWVQDPARDERPWLWLGTRDEQHAEDAKDEVEAAHPDWHVVLYVVAENPHYGPGNPDWERDREHDDAQ